MTPLSRYSIRQQILIGYLPVMIVLGFLAIISFYYFNKVDARLVEIKETNEKNIIFQEVKKDLVELQRNVMVYSYIGYRGVLRKITFLENQIEKKLDIITPSMQDDAEIKERLSRMLGHYAKHKENFKRAIEEKNRLDALNKDKITPIMAQAEALIKKLYSQSNPNDRSEISHSLLDIKYNLYVIKSNAITFNTPPDLLLISKIRNLIITIKKDIKEIQKQENSFLTSADKNELLNLLDRYQAAFKETVRANSTYLHLINVVLAGKTAEMNSLSIELDKLIKNRTQKLDEKLQKNIKHSQTQFIVLLIIAILIGIISSIIIATGISRPLVSITNTLSKLSKGQSDTEIPGQDRLDEMGQMAKAANEFKVMAKDLEVQKAELEEFAYRTSHDLRSPLISSITLLGVIEKSIAKGAYDKAEKSITLVKASLTKLEVLVKDILELTKTKNIEEEKQPIHIGILIEESLSKISHMDNFERLNIIQNLEFEGSIVAAKSRVILIFENLLSNAIKYQDLAKPDSFIKIRSYITQSHFVFSVEDNGLGIPKKHQESLFSMFKRFHPKTSFGSGLGLYMLQKSVNILGGSIAFKDTGDGSLFEVKIPKSN